MQQLQHAIVSDGVYALPSSTATSYTAIEYEETSNGYSNTFTSTYEGDAGERERCGRQRLCERLLRSDTNEEHEREFFNCEGDYEVH